MLAGFVFLFLISGGSTSNISVQTELHGDQPNSNYDNDEGLNISTADILKPPELNGSTNQHSKYPQLQQRNYTNRNDATTTVINQKDVRNPSVRCSHRDVYKYLNLVKDNVNSKIRPSYYRSPTRVKLEMLLYAILDVNEKKQQFVSHIWVFSRWYDLQIYWNPQDFCGIWKIYPPSDVFWTPDLTIEEMINADKLPVSPYLLLDYDGEVFLRSNMVVVSSCRMEVYKFPFDVQNCRLTFKSIVHSYIDLQLHNSADSKWNMDWSLDKMTQSEWLFVNMNISEEIVNNFDLEQTVLVYTITMKRRSALYIANFLLPIMFFLCLDLASFLISDRGGEKLGFKVTVLLAVTVMQLILNEILPASSDRIPLIAVYCIGIFGLMMLSLLETMLMMYLLAKDSASEANWADEDQSRNFKKMTSADETPSEQLAVSKEGDSSKLTVESIALENISDELRDVEKTLTRVLNARKEGNNYWTRVAQKINIVFIVFYVISVIAFLTFLFLLWNKPDDV
ncbi:5-hydroxytryptamine receptor 3A-like [Pungitius pungitius]|uniref:5-hydroxytryptamine receptor 3A-like n=1 Tax=Pungitius pungitius TaxID=134920 RepID=UPI002E15398A